MKVVSKPGGNEFVWEFSFLVELPVFFACIGMGLTKNWANHYQVKCCFQKLPNTGKIQTQRNPNASNLFSCLFLCVI